MTQGERSSGWAFLFSFLLVAAATVFLPGAARAQASPDKAMAFFHDTDTKPVVWGEGARDYIYADGDIESDTPAKLTAALEKYHAQAGTILVLNSNGGNLVAGLEMGKIIREKGLWTEVGSFLPEPLGLMPNVDARYFPYTTTPLTPPFPGYCYSSCTFAFLGGIVRTVGPNSAYGVHRYFLESDQLAPESLTMQLTEQDMAGITSYLEEMGVDPAGFLNEMTKKGPEGVTYLTQKQMADLKVVTPLWQTTWQIQANQNGSGYYYLGTNKAQGQNIQGDEIVECADPAPDKSGIVVYVGVYADPPAGVNATSFASGVTAYNIRYDTDGQVVYNDSKFLVKPAYVSSTGRIAATFGFTLGGFEGILDETQNIGVGFYDPNDSTNSGVMFASTTMSLDREKLDQFALACVKPKNSTFKMVNAAGSANLVKIEYARHSAPSFVPLSEFTPPQPLAPGQSAEIPVQLQWGCGFDLIAHFSDGTKAAWGNVDLCSFGSLHAAVPPAQRPAADTTTEVTNAGSVAITGILISSQDSQSWGPNLLSGGATIAPGSSSKFSLEQYSTCQLDIEVRYANGATEERLNSDLCDWSQSFAAAPPPL